jgi:hypothetical protein
MSRTPGLEPAGWWIVTNLARLAAYVAAACIATGIVAVVVPTFGSPPLENAAVATILLFSYGAIFCLPGTFIWLFVVGSLPISGTTRRRRTIALVTTPLIGGFLFAGLLTSGGTEPVWTVSFALIYGLLLPAGSAFVIRLRGEARPASTSTPGEQIGVR